MGPEDTTQDLRDTSTLLRRQLAVCKDNLNLTFGQPRAEGDSVSQCIFWDKLSGSLNFILVLLDYSESVDL